MIDFTEQEEQEMIDRAKAGDPEANYKMSLWALDRAMEEPEEERWNRLAAKCLVKSAQAGYDPAVRRMNELLKKAEPAGTEPEEEPSEEFDWSAEPETEPAPLPAEPQPGVALRAVALAGVAAKKTGMFFGSLAEKCRRSKDVGAESEEEGVSRPVGRHSTGGISIGKFFDFSGWDDAQWKKMRVVCSVICVVLAVLIALMIVTGKKDKTSDSEASKLPAAATAEPVTATPSPSPVPYPDEATREEIAAASLSVFPEDDEYVAEATTATVSTSGSVLNLRKGPDTNYSQVASMDNGDTAEVYAESEGWSLVKYNGSVWGWCKSSFLKYD